MLFLAILFLDIFLSVSSAYTFFGAQSSLDILPGLFLTLAFSALVFYSLSFMLGELIRRSSLAYIFSSAVFFSSFIISSFMNLVYTLTGKEAYRTIQIILPTTPASSLPIQYAIPRIPSFVGSVLRFIDTSTVVPTMQLFHRDTARIYTIGYGDSCRILSVRRCVSKVEAEPRETQKILSSLYKIKYSSATFELFFA